MAPLGRTAIIYREDPKNTCIDIPYAYKCTGCYTNLNGNTPADQFQKQKLIQNTVRVYASLYTMNLGALSSYVKKTKDTHYVGWNQQSDRNYPSVQKATIKTGFYNSLNGRHHSYTSSRPGTQTPGGVGCDIKHNSYDRYLNKLKARKPLRQGVIPPTFGLPFIPFNRAFPVYGGKQFKTGIINGCDCPDDNKNKDKIIYDNPYIIPQEPIVQPTFIVGMLVCACKIGSTTKGAARIIKDLGNNIFLIQFLDDNTIKEVTVFEIKPFDECTCGCNYNVIYTPGMLVCASKTNSSPKVPALIIEDLGNNMFLIEFKDDNTTKQVNNYEISPYDVFKNKCVCDCYSYYPFNFAGTTITDLVKLKLNENEI
jgi:hypothetical protein